MIFFEALFTTLVATALGASILHKEIHIGHNVATGKHQYDSNIKGLDLNEGENEHQIAKFGNVEISYEVPHAERQHHHDEEGKHRSVVIHIEVDTSHDSGEEQDHEHHEELHSEEHGLKHHLQHLIEHPEEEHHYGEHQIHLEDEEQDEHHEELHGDAGHGLKHNLHHLTEQPEEEHHYGEHQIHLEDEDNDEHHEELHGDVGHGLKHNLHHLTEHPEEEHHYGEHQIHLEDEHNDEHHEELHGDIGQGLKHNLHHLTKHPEEEHHYGEHQIHLEDGDHDLAHQPQSGVHHLQYLNFLNPRVTKYQVSEYPKHGDQHLGGHLLTDHNLVGHQYQPNALDLLKGYGTGVHHDIGYYDYIPQSWATHEMGPHVLPHIGSIYGPSGHQILTHQQTQPWYTVHRLGAVTPSEIHVGFPHSTLEDVEVGNGYGQDAGSRQPFFGSGVLHTKHYGDLHH